MRVMWYFVAFQSLKCRNAHIRPQFDQGGADGERLPQEPLTEPGGETSNNEDVVSDPRNEPNIWGRELNCGKNE